MNKVENQLLTSSQLTFLLFGVTMGTYFLKLPYFLVKIAAQDAWISAILGCVYPLYVIFVACYIIKKHPEDNLLALSRKYLGKVLGTLFNFIFLIQYVLFTATVIADYANIALVYFLEFLNPIKVSIACVLLAAYTAMKGLKVLAKINEFAFFITVPALFFSFLALKYGNLLNVKPVLGAGLPKIIKASKETAYGYLTIELLLLVHPYVKEKNKIKKCGLTAVALTTLIYTWVVFITIFFLGKDIIPKSIFSFIMVTESVQIPIVNNYRAIFMLMWSLVVFKMFSDNYYFTTFILSDLTKINRKKICGFILPVEFFLSLLFMNARIKQPLKDYAVPAIVVFNIFFISLIALLIFIKQKFPSRKFN